MRDDQVARQILEHRRFQRIDSMRPQEFLISLRRGLGLQFGGDDVEHRLEMYIDAKPLQHLVGVIGRADGQNQLASGKPCDRRTHRRIRLQRRMIDLVHIGEIVVGTHAVFGHHAAHAGAVAAIVVLLNPARLIGWYFEISTDELADPLVDLLPQVDVMRIKRVVEVEHPGIDVGEGAGGFHHNLSAVMPANGSRKCAPDGRLRPGIQYAAAIVIAADVSVLDHPLSRVMTAKSGGANSAIHHGIAKRSVLPPPDMSTAAKPVEARPRAPQSLWSLISNLFSRVQSGITPPQLSGLSLNLMVRFSASTASAKLKIRFG